MSTKNASDRISIIIYLKVWKMAKVQSKILRYTEYVYRVGLTMLAGGPHYVGFPTAYPSYLFNVSFALVTIQISSSFSIPRQRHDLLDLASVPLNYWEDDV